MENLQEADREYLEKEYASIFQDLDEVNLSVAPFDVHSRNQVLPPPSPAQVSRAPTNAGISIASQNKVGQGPTGSISIDQRPRDRQARRSRTKKKVRQGEWKTWFRGLVCCH